MTQGQPVKALENSQQAEPLVAQIGPVRLGLEGPSQMSPGRWGRGRDRLQVSKP